MFSVLKMSIRDARDAYIRLYYAAFAPETDSREERAELLKKALKHLLDVGIEGSGSLNARLLETRMKDIENINKGCKWCVSPRILSLLLLTFASAP